jgi:hypothetical protein
VKLLSEKGFKHRLDSIEHEATMYMVYKNEASLKSIENSKKVLIDSFNDHQKAVEKLEKIKSILTDDEIPLSETIIKCHMVLQEK